MMTLKEHNARQKAAARLRREEAARLFRELGNWGRVGQRMGITKQRAYALGSDIVRGIEA